MNKEKKDRPSIEAPQAVKHPDKHPPCYRSETRNPYPLCLGWGMKACAHCCLWTDYDSDEDESRVNFRSPWRSFRRWTALPPGGSADQNTAAGVLLPWTVAGVGRASPSFRDDGVKSILCITSKHATWRSTAIRPMRKPDKPRPRFSGGTSSGRRIKNKPERSTLI